MNKYKIEELLEKTPGSKVRLAKILRVWPWAIKNIFKKWNPRLQTQEKYTNAYNSIFNTNYSWQELFSKEKEEIWEDKKETPTNSQEVI